MATATRSRTRIRRMSVNQHMILGEELNGALNTVSSLLDGTEFTGVIPKKATQRLKKIRSYLNAILSDMSGIASRQYKDLDNNVLASLYGNSGDGGSSGELKEGQA